MQIKQIIHYLVCRDCMEALVFPEALPDQAFTEEEIERMVSAMIPKNHYLLEGAEDEGFCHTLCDCCCRTIGGNFFKIKSMG